MVNRNNTGGVHSLMNNLYSRNNGGRVNNPLSSYNNFKDLTASPPQNLSRGEKSVLKLVNEELRHFEVHLNTPEYNLSEEKKNEYRVSLYKNILKDYDPNNTNYKTKKKIKKVNNKELKHAFGKYFKSRGFFSTLGLVSLAGLAIGISIANPLLIVPSVAFGIIGVGVGGMVYAHCSNTDEPSAYTKLRTKLSDFFQRNIQNDSELREAVNLNDISNSVSSPPSYGNSGLPSYDDLPSYGNSGLPSYESAINNLPGNNLPGNNLPGNNLPGNNLPGRSY